MGVGLALRATGHAGGVRPDWLEGQAELGRRAELLQKFEAFAADDDPTLPYTAKDGPVPTIPGYTIRGNLGKGGMSVVYRAWDEGLHREVALRVMRGGPDMPVPFIRRFAQDARILAESKHDNLVPVYQAKLHRESALISSWN